MSEEINGELTRVFTGFLGSAMGLFTVVCVLCEEMRNFVLAQVIGSTKEFGTPHIYTKYTRFLEEQL
jgi:hypothetical protein